MNSVAANISWTWADLKGTSTSYTSKLLLGGGETVHFLSFMGCGK